MINVSTYSRRMYYSIILFSSFFPLRIGFFFYLSHSSFVHMCIEIEIFFYDSQSKIKYQLAYSFIKKRRRVT